MQEAVFLGIVEIKDVFFSYSQELEDDCLRGISFEVEKGEIFSVLGANGSGKSTLAEHLNALLIPRKGTVSVCSLISSEADNTADIRKKCGMVFSHSSERFFTSRVGDEVGFALTCAGDGTEYAGVKIDEYLKYVGMSRENNTRLDTLSEYECLCVQLASVLAYQPEIVVFDGAAALIAGEEREEYFKLILRLREDGKTIVIFTNQFDEAAVSDKTLLIKNGVAIACGNTREILTDRVLLEMAGIEIPFPLKVYYDLQDSDIKLERPPLTIKELVDEICL